MEEVFKLVIASFGGAGVFAVLFTQYFSKILAEKLLLKHKDKLQRDFEKFRLELELDKLRAERLNATKHAIYGQIWGALEGLDRKGDSLWDVPSTENLLAFLSQLETTMKVVGENKIYLSEEDSEPLEAALSAFSVYSENKGEFIEIRSLEIIDRAALNDIIESNAELRKNYKALLRSILQHIRTQI